MCILPTDRDKKDLAELSSLGHFLKGSSATLGLTKVKVCQAQPLGVISELNDPNRTRVRRYSTMARNAMKLEPLI